MKNEECPRIHHTTRTPQQTHARVARAGRILARPCHSPQQLVIACSCSASSRWCREHGTAPLEALLPRGGLSGLSGGMPPSLYFIWLSDPKADFHQARRPCYGMLQCILPSQEYSHFSGQVPITRAWCQTQQLQNVLRSSITDRRLLDAAAPPPPEEELEAPFNTHPPVSVKIPWHFVEKKQRCIWFTINRIYK